MAKARRPTRPPSEPPSPALTVPREKAASDLASRIDKSREVREHVAQAGDLGQGSAARSEYDAWHNYNVQMLSRMFTDASIAEQYRYSAPGRVLSLGGTIWDEEDRRSDLLETIDANVARLREIREQLELFDEPPQTPAAERSTMPSAPAVQRRAAFVVHGHDEAARESVARTLEQLDVKPIILHEQPNRGRTILEKFEAHADAPFAVVLLTPDDVGGVAGGQQHARARQNVILELGFFWGKLTRERVCVLYKEGVELPSDLGGLLYVKMDDTGAWRFNLADELNAAGIEIDLNRLARRP